MMQKKIIVIMFNFTLCIPSICYGMEGYTQFNSPKIVEPAHISSPPHTIYDPMHQAEFGNNPYNIHTVNYPSIYDNIKNAEAKRTVPNNPTIHEATIPVAIKPTMAQELYLQENSMQQHEQSLPRTLHEQSLPIAQEIARLPIAQEIYVQENSIPSEQVLQSQLDFTSEDASPQQTIDAININEKKFNLSEPSSTSKSSDTVLDIMRKKTIGKFIGHAQQTLFTLIKKNLRINSVNAMVQFSFANLIVEYLTSTLFDLSNIPLSTTIPQNNSYNNFRSQVQYIANQIDKSNKTSSSPDQMLTLIQSVNQFLKENNIILFSQAMFTKLNEVEATAKNCCDIIRNKNLIFTSINVPKDIMIFFKSVIDNTNKLSNITYTQSTMHAIYDTNGYMDNIMQNWKAFKSSDLNTTAVNNQYAAFLTFLLLFENSIVAAAIILDETSALYKVTNPIPVIINIV